MILTKTLRPRFLFRAGFFAEQPVQPLDCAPQVRDRDRAAHDERDVEGVEEFLARDAHFDALLDVVRDAVVAAQDGRGRESYQLLRLLVERALFISLRVEREESFDAEVAAAEQTFVHLRAVAVEFVHRPFPFFRLRARAGAFARTSREFTRPASFRFEDSVAAARLVLNLRGVLEPDRSRIQRRPKDPQARTNCDSLLHIRRERRAAQALPRRRVRLPARRRRGALRAPGA